jgi:hypothetical protein
VGGVGGGDEAVPNLDRSRVPGHELRLVLVIRLSAARADSCPAAMPKKTAAAASAASGAALTCGNAACRKALAPPLLRCGRCKAEAYCCKECQVLPPPRAARGTRAHCK